MDEVLKIKKELEKTVPNNDTARALELLKSLESIPMTLDVLQKTHIGMAVNKLRKSVDNSEISSLSKSMVKKWKKIFVSSSSTSNSTSTSSTTTTTTTTTSSNNNNTNPNSSNNHANSSSINNNESNVSSLTANNSASTNNLQNQEHHSNQQLAPPEKAKRPAPIQTEVPVTTSEVRLKCRQLLTEALRKPLAKELMQEPFLEEEILAGRIEECIYQEFKQTDMKYKNRVRSRVSNLGDPKNPYLRLNVLRGDLAPEKIAKMTADEMASDELKKEREKYTKEAINDHQMTLTSGTKTSEIKCPACKKFNVTYNQVQTRSADEPMTTFCYCNECGKRWKFC